MENETEIQPEKIIDVDKTTLESRTRLIRTQLSDLSVSLRKSIPEGLSDSQLVDIDSFKLWVVCSLILERSNHEAGDGEFNRMMYFLYERCSGNVIEFLTQYELTTDMTDISRPKFGLVILEQEVDDE